MHQAGPSVEWITSGPMVPLPDWLWPHFTKVVSHTPWGGNCHPCQMRLINKVWPWCVIPSPQDFKAWIVNHLTAPCEIYAWNSRSKLQGTSGKPTFRVPLTDESPSSKKGYKIFWKVHWWSSFNKYCLHSLSTCSLLGFILDALHKWLHLNSHTRLVR